MDWIVVRGVSQKGKNRVRERGDTWRVVDTADRVRFDDKPGPWLCLESLDKSCLRWMHATHDDDFAEVTRRPNRP